MTPRPERLAQLCAAVVAKLRPEGKPKGASEGAAPAAGQRTTAPLGALRALGVARLVVEPEQVELVDDEDVALLDPHTTLTVHWADSAANGSQGRHMPPAAGRRDDEQSSLVRERKPMKQAS